MGANSSVGIWLILSRVLFSKQSEEARKSTCLLAVIHCSKSLAWVLCEVMMSTPMFLKQWNTQEGTPLVDTPPKSERGETFDYGDVIGVF